MTRRRTSLIAGLIGAAGLYGVIGCSGSATVHSMPFLRHDFSATESPAHKIDIDEAYYWVDEQERLNVALRRYVPSLLGKAHEYDWRLSLVLEDLPAGSEKLYRLGADSVRLLISHGGSHARGSSLMGVAVVHAPRNDLLRGRFHVDLRQQAFTVLTGWAPPLGRAPLVVMAGPFEAIHDPVRGRAIRDRTEADGMERRWRSLMGANGAFPIYPTTTQVASRPTLSTTRPAAPLMPVR